MNLENVLVVSDLDGTLIDGDFTVPERNLRAIERLKRQGGHFTVATGRSPESGGRYIAAVEPNSPCILLNGTVLYDFAKKEVLWNRPLDPVCARDCMDRIHARFPKIGVEIFGTTGESVPYWNDRVHSHLEREGIHRFVPDIFDGQPLCKMLLIGEADEIQRVIDFTKEFDHAPVRFVLSSKNYLEMLPFDTNKGFALRELIRMCGFSIDRVYAIGDYYNDVELLQAAGFAAMPQNAPEELKENADLVVCDCNEGAIADLVEYIEQKQG